MDQPLLEGWAARLRHQPFAVDAALAAAFFLVCGVLLGAGYQSGDTLVFGALLSAPLAWRRRAPVAAAAVVVVLGLLQLVVVGTTLLPADLAALVMVYSLAAYAPGWASRAGLAAGLGAAVLAALRYYSGLYEPQSLAFMAGAIGVTVVAAWALGDLRRARLQQLSGLAERARLLELERDQEMRLAATTERARIAREMHDVVAHSLSVVIAQADGGRYAGQADPAAATGALEAIASSGRQALTDMRALLGVLREDGAHEYAPSPTSRRSTSWSPTCRPAGWTST